MVNKLDISIEMINNELVRQISIDKAYKIAIKAKNNNDIRRANEVIAIISRTIKNDSINGYYTGLVKFVGLDEYGLIAES